MPFTLQRDEPVGEGLSRIVRKTLKRAVEAAAVPTPTDAIHALRKSVKKSRAIIVLVASVAKVRRIDRQLRRLGHRLSPLRDAHAIADTLQRVIDRAPAATRRSLAPVKRRLAAQARRMERAAVDDDRLRDAADDLRRVRRAFQHAHLDRVDLDDVADAVRSSYRKARRALRTAGNGGDANDFHRWRKRVKTLWYHTRLLDGRWRTHDLLTALGQIEEWLGEDHNVTVLREHLGADRRLQRTPLFASFEQVCDVYQAELRRKALEQGERVLRDRPKVFQRRVRARSGRTSPARHVAA